MTSSVHHIVADLAARLDYIERALKEDYAEYAAAQAESNAMGGSVGEYGFTVSSAGGGTVTSSNAPLLPGATRSTSHPSSSVASCRLNLSQRLASINNTFSKSLVHATASEIGERLSACSSALLPSYITSEVLYEPDRLIDSEVSAQRYAVIKRRLNADGQQELEMLKMNIKALCESSFARDETGAVIADVLAYDGPSPQVSSGSVDEANEQPSSSGPSCASSSSSSIRAWVTRAASNNKRAQELHLRLAKAKARYESLVNYSNKQMCVWDLQIEELEKRAHRQAAQKR